MRALQNVSVILLLFVLTVTSSFELAGHDRILPHVHMAGVDLSGQTQNDAAAQLHPFSMKMRFRVVALNAPGHVPIYVSAAALGYRFDGTASIRRAFNVGRNGSLKQRLTEQVDTMLRSKNVAIVQYVDHHVLLAYLFTLASKLNQPPKVGLPGRRLNVALVNRRIGNRLLQAGPFRVDLPFIAIPALPSHRTTRQRWLAAHMHGFIGSKQNQASG